MLVDRRQFGEALKSAEAMDEQQLRRASGGGTSRSYWVRHNGRLFPMKAILRLAYLQSKLEWDGPHSKTAADALRSHFDIIYMTEASEKTRLQREWESISRQKRDARFRLAMLELYGATCAVSGCTVLDALDAAHVLGVSEAGSDRPQNGLILRADLHRLFDSHLMAIAPEDGRVHFAEQCQSHYEELSTVTVRLPLKGPQLADFSDRWTRFQSRMES